MLCSHCCCVRERAAEGNQVCLGGRKQGGEEWTPERHLFNSGISQPGMKKDNTEGLFQCLLPLSQNTYEPNETALITGTLKATFLGLWNTSLLSGMFRRQGSEEGKVLILTWDSEFSGLNPLREGPLSFSPPHPPSLSVLFLSQLFPRR